MITTRRISLGLFIAFVCFWGVGLAHAQQDNPLTAILTLAPIDPLPVGSRFKIEATLVNNEERPIPNKVLIVYINQERIRSARTDENGQASIGIGQDLPVGLYQVEVEFPGTQAYNGTKAALQLSVRPILMVLETIPPLAHLTFSLDGRNFVTDEKGIGQMEVLQPGIYQLQAPVSQDMQVDEETQATFSRWGDSAFQPERTVEVNGDIHLQAGFVTSHQVGLSFVDLSGAAVSSSRVSSVTLKRSDGDYATYQNGQPQWLQATRVVRRREGLEASRLLYSLESVMVDGANIVNRYQQRFYVESTNTWQLQLLLYNARIHATDAIFGFPIGKGVSIEYPNGDVKLLDFGENHEVYQTSLARGIYNVKVTGASGMSPVTPMAMSKDQVVELKVLSALDIGAGIVLGIVLAVGLFLYGRPHIVNLPFRLSFPRIRRPLGATTYQNIPAEAPASTMSISMSNLINQLAPESVGATTYQNILAEAPASTMSISMSDVITQPVPEFDEEHSIACLTEYFHPDGLRCPHCHHTEAQVVGINRVNCLSIYRCQNCKHTYNLYTETPFAKSHLTPTQVVYLLSGLSSGQDKTQLANELGINIKTVVKWQHRLQGVAEHFPAEPEFAASNNWMSPQKAGGEL